jgi:hypothetical protein
MPAVGPALETRTAPWALTAESLACQMSVSTAPAAAPQAAGYGSARHGTEAQAGARTPDDVWACGVCKVICKLGRIPCEAAATSRGSASRPAPGAQHSGLQIFAVHDSMLQGKLTRHCTLTPALRSACPCNSCTHAAVAPRTSLCGNCSGGCLRSPSGGSPLCASVPPLPCHVRQGKSGARFVRR